MAESGELAPSVMEHSKFVTVSKVYKHKGGIVKESETSEPIKVVTFHPQSKTATVSVDASFTKNLGDFNSLKVGVFVSLPCYIEELDDAFATAKQICETKLKQAMEDTKK